MNNNTLHPSRRDLVKKCHSLFVISYYKLPCLVTAPKLALVSRVLDDRVLESVDFPLSDLKLPRPEQFIEFHPAN